MNTARYNLQASARETEARRQAVRADLAAYLVDLDRRINATRRALHQAPRPEQARLNREYFELIEAHRECQRALHGSAPARSC